MRCEEMIQVLEELAAQSMACSWDNPGLLVGWREKEIKKVYVRWMPPTRRSRMRSGRERIFC